MSLGTSRRSAEIGAIWARRTALLIGLLGLPDCASNKTMRIVPTPSMGVVARHRSGGPPTADLEETRFRAGLCDGEDLRPQYTPLDEGSLVQFLQRQRLDVRIERPRADLIYLNVGGAGTQYPIRLRVAILRSADEAGRELYEAILQHGRGAWGVHRSNLAVLGPAGDPTDDVIYAGTTKLACWGVFTMAGGDDAVVIPGGYREL